MGEHGWEKVAKLQGYKVAELQSCKVAEPDHVSPFTH